MQRITILLCLSMSSILASAQYQYDEQHTSWYMYFGNHRISEKVSIHTEYQWRRYGLVENWQQSLLRFGLDYHSKSGAMWTGGYAWIRSYPYGVQPIAYPFNEHRIWQQLYLTQLSGRFYLNHRFRTEQRFLERKEPNENNEYVTDEYIFRQRARYRFYAAFPLTSKKMKDNTLFLGFYDEVMIGFGGGSGTNTLQQNRLYGALGWRFDSNANVQLGYLNNIIFKGDGRAEINHTFQLALFYNIDFRRGQND